MDRTKEICIAMAAMLRREGQLSQEVAARRIADDYGVSYLYCNKHGNPAISKRVLRRFKKLTGTTVVWSRADRCWRKRHSNDVPRKRMQA